jgi:hypothetical protein
VGDDAIEARLRLLEICAAVATKHGSSDIPTHHFTTIYTLSLLQYTHHFTTIYTLFYYSIHTQFTTVYTPFYYNIHTVLLQYTHF